MSARISAAALALGLGLASPAFASDVGYLYGRVEMVDGDTYQGQLRWGTEEAFWEDMFNADKAENENLDYVDHRTLDRLRWHRTHGWDLFGLHDSDLTHVFAVRFGDLMRIEVRGGDRTVVEFRNGEELRLNGGSNDIGAQITVVDPKQGRHELRWRRIRSIEFMPTPTKLENKLGDPIYGTVKSGKYDFTGRIQWDNDECLTTDKLDGDTRDGRAHVAFGDITSIRKHRDGVIVTTKAGSEFFMDGTNDVNRENRGVVVIVPRIGSVKIGWDDFDEVTFARAPNSGQGYPDFAPGRRLEATVVTRDGREDGRLIYDLDESWDFELLQGTNGSTEYLIPFRDIARIRPLGRRRSEVELRMGLTVELEDGQDVTSKNDGLLVFASDRAKPKYVDWRDVTEVVFR